MYTIVNNIVHPALPHNSRNLFTTLDKQAVDVALHVTTERRLDNLAAIPVEHNETKPTMGKGQKQSGIGPLTMPDLNAFLRPFVRGANEPSGVAGGQPSFINDDLTQIADIYIARFGRLDDDLVFEICLYHNEANASNYRVIRNFLMKYQYEAQYHTVEYSKQSMEKLVEVSGGQASWATASVTYRRNLVTVLFDQYPLTFCKLAFKYEDHVVDFEGIWGRYDEERRPWQEMFRERFVALAVETYIHSTSKIGVFASMSTEEIRKLEQPIFDFYNGLMRSAIMTGMRLGPVGLVPTRPKQPKQGGRSR